MNQSDFKPRGDQLDRDAFAALMRRCDPRIRPQIATQIPSRWQALLSVDDVLQQTYADAFADSHRLGPRGEGSLLAWLRSAALNNLQDAIRELEAEKRGGNRRQVRGDSSASQDLLIALATSSASGTPSRQAMSAEADQVLRAAIGQLPEAQRRTVELYDLRGRPVEEVAAEIGRSAGAVHMLRLRAHRRLREILMGQTTIFRTPA